MFDNLYVHSMCSIKMDVRTVCFSTASPLCIHFYYCLISVIYLEDQMSAGARATVLQSSRGHLRKEHSVNRLQRKHPKKHPAYADSALWTGTWLFLLPSPQLPFLVLSYVHGSYEDDGHIDCPQDAHSHGRESYAVE